jgi:hypothetical protein
MTLYELLVLMHIVGTVLGVGAATFAEIYYTRFNSDDIVNDDERKVLSITYTVMRAGLFLLVISGFSFVLYFRLTEHVEILTSPSFLAKMTIVAVLVGNALLLQARMVPFAIGAAGSLTSWYAALVLGVVGETGATYLEILFYYAVAIVLVGICVRWIRARLHAPQRI